MRENISAFFQFIYGCAAVNILEENVELFKTNRDIMGLNSEERTTFECDTNNRNES